MHVCVHMHMCACEGERLLLVIFQSYFVVYVCMYVCVCVHMCAYMGHAHLWHLEAVLSCYSSGTIYLVFEIGILTFI